MSKLYTKLNLFLFCLWYPISVKRAGITPPAPNQLLFILFQLLFIKSLALYHLPFISRPLSVFPVVFHCPFMLEYRHNRSVIFLINKFLNRIRSQRFAQSLCLFRVLISFLDRKNIGIRLGCKRVGCLNGQSIVCF